MEFSLNGRSDGQRSPISKKFLALRYTVAAPPPTQRPWMKHAIRLSDLRGRIQGRARRGNAMVPEGRLTCTKCGGPLNAREGRICWPVASIKPPRVAYRSRGGSTNLPAIYSCFIARFGGVSDGKETHGDVTAPTRRL